MISWDSLDKKRSRNCFFAKKNIMEMWWDVMDCAETVHVSPVFHERECDGFHRF